MKFRDHWSTEINTRSTRPSPLPDTRTTREGVVSLSGQGLFCKEMSSAINHFYRITGQSMFRMGIQDMGRVALGGQPEKQKGMLSSKDVREKECFRGTKIPATRRLVQEKQEKMPLFL